MCICIRPLERYIREYQNSKRDPRGFPQRMSFFETSFNAKQPKLELKLVGVSIEQKQTEEQRKQFDREHILVFFQKILGCFGLFGLFRNSLFWLFRFYTETESLMFWLNRNKQKSNGNSLIDSILWYFKENLGLFRFVSVCFETVLFVSVVSM